METSSDAIVTFSCVPRYLQRTGRPVALSPQADLVQCRFESRAASAVVAMRPLTSRGGAAWLAASIPIGAVERIRPRAALVANDELPIGALALFQNIVLLRQTLPLAGLPFAELEHTLGALVHLAAVLVAAAASTAADPEREVAFGYLFR
jgi:hypothetical protein